MERNPNPLRVALMEHNTLIRQAIKHQLEGQDDLLLVEEIDTAETLYSLLANNKPDVLLFDAHVPQSQRHPLLPLRLVKALHKVGRDHPRVAIILLARHYLPLAPETRKWVRGYILHGDEAALKLAATVRYVHKGSYFYSKSVRREISRARAAWRETKQLEKVQVAILSLIASAPQVDESRHAEALGMSEAAYQMHLQRALRTLRVTGRLEAVLRALQLGLLRVEELG